ncbi:MAG: DNA-binding protein [Thermoprotei archaeon]|nr:MAG: DNA-binding protein [Thermoprotei archaeon]
MYKIGRIFLFRVPEEVELIKYLTEFAIRNNIKMAYLSGIGAFSEVKMGYFVREKNAYEPIEYNRLMELISLTGNISIKEGKPVPHIHVVLGDRHGHTIGGHLLEAKVYMVEILVVELLGPILERQEVAPGIWFWPETKL